MKIQRLILNCKDLEQQQAFYNTSLGLVLLEKSANHFVVKVGTSLLEFHLGALPSKYHFAFNIPSNQIKEALIWLQQKTSILSFEGKKIQDFYNWNAEAIYFYDADGNILELIARKNSQIQSQGEFSAESIINISEVGVPSANIEKLFKDLQKGTGIEQYSGDLESFCAAGDEDGLFILVNEIHKNWFPTSKPAKPLPITLYFSNADNDFLFEYKEDEGFQYSLKSP